VTAARSIGRVLDESGGIGAGFDFLRVALAVCVVTWHQFAGIGGGAAPKDGFSGLFGASILPMFFGLSGFLIAGSALRLRLKDFLINRGLRIFPALVVEILLSAFLLGPLVTILALDAYFSSPATYAYLTNILGLINYHLPGVFVGNPSSVVNWSLWTIPYELICYAIMAALMLFGALKKPAFILCVFAGWLVLTGGAAVYASFSAPLPGAVQFILFGRGTLLLIAFLGGIAAYLYRYRTPYSPTLALASLVGLLLLGVVNMSGGPLALAEGVRWGAVFLLKVPPLLYLTVFIGASRIRPLPLYRHGDYSYGIYLYGAPIQQTIKWAAPSLPAYFAFPLGLAAITAFAMFSWHVIEKPVLRLRRRFSFVARARGVAGSGTSEVGAPPAVRDEAGTVLSYGQAETESAPGHGNPQRS
jgi:peptidoglycan/LPS O-acetylase OafA/YrhL